MKNKTGAKLVRTGAAFLLAGALMFGTGAQVAEAAVHPSVIVEANQEEVKGQREYEVTCIQNYLAGTDYTGNRMFDNERIRECIALSNILNAYDPDFYTFTNTTPNEVLNLDIEGIFQQFMYAENSNEPGAFDSFINTNLNNKPAIDATVQLSTGVLSADIKQRIGEIIANKILESGATITEYPYVVVDNGSIYVLAGINGKRQIYTVDGMSIPGVYEAVKALDERYTMIIDNLKGDSPEYPNALSYNGINQENGESVWLSLGDDDIKPIIENGMEISDSLNNDPTIGVEFAYPDYYEFPTYEELVMFQQNGINAADLTAVPKTPIYITSEIDYAFMLGQ